MNEELLIWKAKVQYLGSDFFGWQKQIGVPTIQARIEEVLSQIFQQVIKVNGIGRTDAKVNALGQNI